MRFNPRGGRTHRGRQGAERSDPRRRERHAEALAPDDDAAVGGEVDRARDRVVLGADVALETAEVDEAVVERAGRTAGPRRGQVDLQQRPVGRAEVLEADVAAAADGEDRARPRVACSEPRNGAPESVCAVAGPVARAAAGSASSTRSSTNSFWG
jgi:hypothetical protein